MEENDALEMQTNWPCGHATKTKEDTDGEGFWRGGREVRPRILDRWRRIPVWTRVRSPYWEYWRSDWLLNMHWLDCSLSKETLLFSLSRYSCSSLGSWFKFLRCGCGMSSRRYSAYYHKSMQVPWLQSGGTSSRWNVFEYSFSLSYSVNCSQIFLGNRR